MSECLEGYSDGTKSIVAVIGESALDGDAGDGAFHLLSADTTGGHQDLLTRILAGAMEKALGALYPDLY